MQLEHVYLQSRERLRAVARRLVEATEAEDVVHDAFLRALQCQDAFRGESTLQTWLYRIVVNAGIDRARRKRREQRVTADVDRGLPEQLAIEDRIAMRRVLAGLGQWDRRTCLSHYVAGVTLRELSAYQRLPVGTLKSRLFEARRRLRTALEGVGCEGRSFKARPPSE